MESEEQKRKEVRKQVREHGMPRREAYEAREMGFMTGDGALLWVIGIYWRV